MKPKQKTYQTYQTKNLPKHIIIKVAENNKEKILKAAREKRYYT